MCVIGVGSWQLRTSWVGVGLKETHVVPVCAARGYAELSLVFEMWRMEVGTKYRGINLFNFSRSGGCYADLNIPILSSECRDQRFKLGQRINTDGISETSWAKGTFRAPLPLPGTVTGTWGHLGRVQWGLQWVGWLLGQGCHLLCWLHGASGSSSRLTLCRSALGGHLKNRWWWQLLNNVNGLTSPKSRDTGITRTTLRESPGRKLKVHMCFYFQKSTDMGRCRSVKSTPNVIEISGCSFIVFFQSAPITIVFYAVSDLEYLTSGPSPAAQCLAPPSSFLQQTWPSQVPWRKLL